MCIARWSNLLDWAILPTLVLLNPRHLSVQIGTLAEQVSQQVGRRAVSMAARSPSTQHRAGAIENLHLHEQKLCSNKGASTHGLAGRALQVPEHCARRSATATITASKRQHTLSPMACRTSILHGIQARPRHFLRRCSVLLRGPSSLVATRVSARLCDLLVPASYVECAYSDSSAKAKHRNGIANIKGSTLHSSKATGHCSGL